MRRLATSAPGDGHGLGFEIDGYLGAWVGAELGAPDSPLFRSQARTRGSVVDNDRSWALIQAYRECLGDTPPPFGRKGHGA